MLARNCTYVQLHVENKLYSKSQATVGFNFINDKADGTQIFQLCLIIYQFHLFNKEICIWTVPLTNTLYAYTILVSVKLCINVSIHVRLVRNEILLH